MVQALPSSVVIATVKPTLESGLRAIAAGDAEFDFSAVTELDSAGVAMLLAWQRAAAERGLQLKISNAPAGLRSLASLYGVAELLPA